MGEQQKQDGHPGQQPDEKPSDEVTVKSKFRLFHPGYFANNDWAILLFGFAILFAGVVIPSSYYWKLICGGMCLSCCVVLVVHAIKNRNVPTDEEIEGQRDENVRSQLDYLHKGLGDLRARLQAISPRRLTSEQKTAIAEAMRPFAGTKISVKYRQGIDDGPGLAQDFFFAFAAAGLDCGPIGSSADFTDCDHCIVCINKEDAIVNAYPLAMLSMNCILANLGFMRNPNLHAIVNEVPKGSFRLIVAPNPGWPPTPPAKKFVVIHVTDDKREAFGITDSPNQNFVLLPPPPPQTPPSTAL